MSTPLDYAEFYFDHVDKGESMKAPDEGVAAPLEPHIHEIDDFKTQRCTVCGKYLGATPELEISARTFRRKLDNGEFGSPTSVNAIEKCLEAYAAAVSKNLQRYKNAINNHLCEYDAADWLACRGCHTKGDGKVYCVVCEESGDHAHKERDVLSARILGLEKEIASLRETKP
jgi:hypothetical protein